MAPVSTIIYLRIKESDSDHKLYIDNMDFKGMIANNMRLSK